MAHSGLNFEMHQGEFDFVQDSQGQSDIHETDSVLEMLPPKPSKSIKKVTKRLSQRGKAFSKEEDRIICSAFLNVSKDPITGTLFSLNYQISCHITLRQFSSSHIYIVRNKPI